MGHVIRLMRLGANDVLRLPMNSNEPNLEDRIARFPDGQPGVNLTRAALSPLQQCPTSHEVPPGYHCQLRSEGAGQNRY